MKSWAEELSPRKKWTKCSRNRARSRRSSITSGAWDIDQQLNQAHGTPCACPPRGREDRPPSSGRRKNAAVASCRLLLQKPDILILDEAHQPPRTPNPVAVARTHQPPSSTPGHDIHRRHPTTATSSTTRPPAGSWELDRGAGIPVQGELQRARPGSRRRLGWRWRRRSNRARQNMAGGRASWSGWRESRPSARQAKSKAASAGVTRRWSGQGREGEGEGAWKSSLSRPGPAPGPDGESTAVNLSKSPTATAWLFEKPQLPAASPPNGIVGIIGPQRRRPLRPPSFRIINGFGETRRPARSRSPTAVKLAYVEQSRDKTSATTGPSGRPWPTARKPSALGGQGPNPSRPRLRRPLHPSPGLRPAEKKVGRPLRRRNATASTLARMLRMGAKRPSSSTNPPTTSTSTRSAPLEDGPRKLRRAAPSSSATTRWFPSTRWRRTSWRSRGDSQVVFFEGKLRPNTNATRSSGWAWTRIKPHRIK